MPWLSKPQKDDRYHIQCPIPPADLNRKLSFHAIDGLIADWEDIFPADDEHDIVWYRNQVFMVDKSGRRQKLFSISSAHASQAPPSPGARRSSSVPERGIHGVVHDGLYTWVVTTDSGIRAIRSDEQQCVFNNSVGLPEYSATIEPNGENRRYNDAVLLHPLDQGTLPGDWRVW